MGDSHNDTVHVEFDRAIELNFHGSTITRMTHIAIQAALDGKVVEWLEKVTDEQYKAAR